MKRIVIAAFVLALVTVGAFPATKAKMKVSRIPTVLAQTSPSVPLTELFPGPASQEIAGGGGMVMMAAPNAEVVIARINDDGTRSYACVNTEAAARSFLSAPKKSTAPVKHE